MNGRPSRREFFGGLAAVAAWTVGLIVLRNNSGAAYRPAGHLTMQSPLVRNVKTVTLDGKVIKDVFELDDVEGWVRRYARSNDGKHIVDDDGGTPYMSYKLGGTTKGWLRVERLTGQVRVEWKV